ncbi:Cathepsin L [Blattella germanica]|nr:Cathepsin L [Blattella germanica]
MKWLIPLFMAVIACKAISLMELQLTEWEEFKIKYGKKYATAEEDEFRMNIYQQKKLEIEKHNLAYLKGVHSYELGMNQFGDLTGSLEGQQFRKSGKLIRLSEQNLVDCTFDYDNKGCKGGWMDHAFQYVKDNGGIDTSEAYIYESEQGKCRFNASGIGATISNIVILESANETQLMEAVATVGPISVVIQVTKSFPYYTKGNY